MMEQSGAKVQYYCEQLSVQLNRLKPTPSKQLDIFLEDIQYSIVHHKNYI
jgi:hypothetical protein